MFIDMHIHEKLFSPDSRITIEDIVEVARNRGLEAVCITDHDNMDFYEYADYYSKKLAFPIFTGIEFYSDLGDITAWAPNLHKQSFPLRGSAAEFTEKIHKMQGFCVACHPYRNNNRGLGDNISVIKYLNGVEVLNGSTDVDANRKAYDICVRCGLKQIGASDAHVRENIAKFVTYLPEKVNTTEEFVELLRCTDQLRAAYWDNNSYRIVNSVEEVV